MSESPILEMLGIRKTFHGVVQALKGVDFVVGRGHIHGLIGENGAGKSTLMNILGGVLFRDAGEIRKDGDDVHFRTTSDARHHRISFIHQELNLVPDLTVYENIFLGEEPRTRFGLIDIETMRRDTRELMDRLEMKISPEAVVRDLGATEKQVVEIARALHQNADLLIMDEPTTSLTDHEIEHVFAIVRNLRDKGVSIIFISHKLNEVLSLCDHYTVLRDGEVSGTGVTDGLAEEDLVRMMVGRDLEVSEPACNECGEPVLEVEGLTSEGCYSNVSFSLREGEVLGFTGLAGDGRTELFESIFGVRPIHSGSVRIKGRDYTDPKPWNAKRAGLGYVPKDRKVNSVIKDLSIRENISLPSLRKFSQRILLDRRTEGNRALHQAQRLNMKFSSLDDPIGSLSGGNQQKAVLGKWLEAESEILVLDNPTQGIDVGAKNEIYELIRSLAESGKSIVVLSSEFPEIRRVCDRVIVMYHGRITGDIPRGDADDETLMMYTTGVLRDDSLQQTTAGQGR